LLALRQANHVVPHRLLIADTAMILPRPHVMGCVAVMRDSFALPDCHAWHEE
jgi:hypothetical protein